MKEKSNSIWSCLGLSRVHGVSGTKNWCSLWTNASKTRLAPSNLGFLLFRQIVTVTVEHSSAAYEKICSLSTTLLNCLPASSFLVHISRGSLRSCSPKEEDVTMSLMGRLASQILPGKPVTRLLDVPCPVSILWSKSYNPGAEAAEGRMAWSLKVRSSQSGEGDSGMGLDTWQKY